MSLEKLTEKQVSDFALKIYEIAEQDGPVDQSEVCRVIERCVNESGLFSQVAAFASEDTKSKHAKTFYDTVLTDILTPDFSAIDEAKFKQKLEAYELINKKDAEEHKKRSGDERNLGYVSRLNNGLKIPHDYTLTETDVLSFLKHVFSIDKFPAQVEEGVYVASYAELSDREHTQKLRTVLEEAIDNSDSLCDIIYVPLNLGGYHWVYLVVEFDDEGKLDVVTCIDSLDINYEHKKKLAEKLFKELKEINNLEFSGDFNPNNIFFDRLQKQKDNFSCGYRMLRGILDDVGVENKKTKKITEANLGSHELGDLQRVVFDAIEAEAIKDGVLKKKKPLSRSGSSFYDDKKKKAETKVKVKISEEVVKNIKDHLLSDDKFKPLSENEKFKNWPVRLEYISDKKDAEPCIVVIDQEQEGGEDYLTFKTYASDLDTNKAVIDKAVAMGLKTLQISGDKEIVAELEKYCQDKYKDVIIGPASAVTITPPI